MKKIFNIWTVIFLALILRIVNLNQSFWLDEAAQVIESSRPFFQQFDLAADFHPPLYHLILHFWLLAGRSEIWIRLISVSFGIGSIVFLYLVAKVFLKEKFQAQVAAIFLVLSPYHIWYSQESRPYMAFLFFSFAATYFILEKNWLFYLISLILSLYTHYFTFFLLAGYGIYVLLFEKKYLKTWFTYTGIAMVSFVFWLPEFFKQLNIGTKGLFSGWTDVVSVSPLRTSLLTFAKFIFGRGTIENKYLYATIILPVFLLFVLALVKIYKSKQGKILLALFFVPFIAAELVSAFIPIVAPQRFIFLLPLFYLVLAYGIYSFPKKMQIIAIIIVVFTSIGGIYQYYTDPNVQRERWREAVIFTEAQPNSQSTALFVFPSPFAPYMWYSKGKLDAWGIAPKFIVTDEDLQVLNSKLRDKRKIYLYQYLTGLTDPQSKVGNFLSSNGFYQSSVNNFPGVGFIYTYDKK